MLLFVLGLVFVQSTLLISNFLISNQIPFPLVLDKTIKLYGLGFFSLGFSGVSVGFLKVSNILPKYFNQSNTFIKQATFP